MFSCGKGLTIHWPDQLTCRTVGFLIAFLIKLNQRVVLAVFWTKSCCYERMQPCVCTTFEHGKSPEAPANLNLYGGSVLEMHKALCFCWSSLLFALLSFLTVCFIWDISSLWSYLISNSSLPSPSLCWALISDVDVWSLWSRKLLPCYGSSCTCLSSDWFCNVK